MRLPRTLLALTVAGTTLLMAAAPASAAGPIDQQQSSIATGCLLVPAGPNPTHYAQTFTAGRAGTLDQVEYFLARGEAADPTPFTLEVHGVAADGSPTDPVLTSATVPAASVPVRGDQPGTEGAWIAFPVAPIASAVGQHYAIIVTRGTAAWSFCSDTTNPYAGGSAWGRGDGGPWFDLGAINYDWAFRTHVTAAAPANPLQGTLDGVTALLHSLGCTVQALLGTPCV